ncbi:hypothetical protein BGX26_004091 [Mortierella sp. AD094]|nr:hypothetical protein BGX26_004091 [Mortierella sp. AD094]
MSSPNDFLQTIQGMSSKKLGTLNMSQYSRAQRRIINDELVRRSDERKAGKPTIKTKSRNPMPSSWSLYPELDWSVDEKLMKPHTFYDVDDGLHALKEYDTFVSGVFLCSKRCSKRGWSSGKIAISIRLYDDDQYNARIHHQRCRGCDALSRPTLDAEAYGERVSYRLNKWSRFKVVLPKYESKQTPPTTVKIVKGVSSGDVHMTNTTTGTSNAEETAAQTIRLFQSSAAG